MTVKYKIVDKESKLTLEEGVDALELTISLKEWEDVIGPQADIIALPMAETTYVAK